MIPLKRMSSEDFAAHSFLFTIVIEFQRKNSQIPRLTP
jgi:hypothetical protein